MAKRKLPPLARKAWENAENCTCGAQQDENGTHKKCFRCEEPMEYGAYEAWQPNNPSCWNVEHRIPKKEGGTNRKDNVVAVHKKCNQ